MTDGRADWPRPWDLVGIGEAAKELGIHRATLNARIMRSIDSPRPVTVIGKSPVFDLLELKEWNAEWERDRGGRASEAQRHRSG